MRATVGPLPPAVYWRRRVVVLGAVLLGVIVLFMSCSGGDEPDPKKTSAQAPQSSGASPKPSPSLEDSIPPGVGDAYPDPPDLFTPKPGDDAALPAPVNSASGAGPGNVPPGNVPPGNVAPGNVVPAGQGCTDAELALTPEPADTSPQRGAPMNIKLKIKNVSNRACSRDLGASAQELYIADGAQRLWSSDQCAGIKGNDIVTLAAGTERVFEVTWNGKQSNLCTGVTASGPAPAAGAYKLFGRLDQMVSAPVVLTVVA